MLKHCAILTLLILDSQFAVAQRMSPRDVDHLPSSPPNKTVQYGADPLQVGDLRLPHGKGPFPVVVVVHGGCWTKGFATRQNTAALASALTDAGFATWNIEYRQVGEAGSGWPGTFKDWADATDYLRVLAKTQPLQLDKVSAVGHSAGATAALWLASRAKLPATSEVRGANPLPLKAAVAIDGPPGVAEFIGADAQICGKPVIEPLMGGSPGAFPARYKESDAAQRLPLGMPQLLVASVVLPAEEANAYRDKAVAAGDPVQVLLVHNGGHFDIIAPGSEAWKTIGPALIQELRDALR
jgi:acetyl esterase/lipase